MRIFGVVALAVLACGGDNKQAIDAAHPLDAARDAQHHDAPVDASQVDLSCAGSALPTTAPDPVTIGGRTVTLGIGGLTVVPNVTVDAFVDDGSASLGSTVSDGSGDYTFDVPTGGSAVEGYLVSSKDGFVNTYTAGPTVVYEDVGSASAIIVSQDSINLIENVAGVDQHAGSGLMAITVIDCNGSAVSGATIATDPAGDLLYESGGAPSGSATETDISGTAFVFDLPVGDITVTAQYDTTALRSHVAPAFADQATFTSIQP